MAKSIVLSHKESSLPLTPLLLADIIKILTIMMGWSHGVVVADGTPIIRFDFIKNDHGLYGLLSKNAFANPGGVIALRSVLVNLP